jgi:diadenosine tetraphosphate (Ap4A) HIT family hydrolase
MSPEFSLDPRLRSDSLELAELELCSLRLMDDRRFPWLLLVPKRPDLREIIDLPAFEQAQLLIEINRAAKALRQLTDAHKLNIAALGNVVPQLHVHVIARFPEDAAWPAPVWGHGSREPYPPEAAAERIAALRLALQQVDDC